MHLSCPSAPQASCTNLRKRTLFALTHNENVVVSWHTAEEVTKKKKKSSASSKPEKLSVPLHLIQGRSQEKLPGSKGCEINEGWQM